jgi:hypothetical protein
LCREHHRELHRVGNEAAWWANLQIVPLEVAKDLWEASQPRSSALDQRGARASRHAHREGPVLKSRSAPRESALVGHETGPGYQGQGFAELRSLSEPLLLPGESLRDFEFMRTMIIDEVRPQNFIEWLWTFDLVELSWEILRYRRFKMRMLDAHRATAIESLLLLLEEGLPDEAAPLVQAHARRAKADWRSDPNAAAEIEARLARSGFDQSDISVETVVQARELFGMLDQLMHSAQGRRIALLREIDVRRKVRLEKTRKLS